MLKCLQCLIPDGRITKTGLSNLLRATDCKVWLYAQEDVSSLEELGIYEFSAKMQPFPTLEWCLSADGAPDYPYEKTWEEAKFEDILIIHTSGTTGKIAFFHSSYKSHMSDGIPKRDTYALSLRYAQTNIYQQWLLGLSDPNRHNVSHPLASGNVT